MFKFKKNFAVLFFLLFLNVFIVGCNNHKEQTQVYTESAHYKKFDLASHIKLDKQILENLLIYEKNGKKYELLPATNSEKDLNLWKDLVVNGNKDYIGAYFLDHKLRTEIQAEKDYEKAMTAMWQCSPPDKLFFLILLDGKFAGIIVATDLNSENKATISYITVQHQTGKGVATNALYTIVTLLKYLKSTDFYTFSDVSLWIFDDNFASIKVAEKNGFVYTEADVENNRARYSLKL